MISDVSITNQYSTEAAAKTASSEATYTNSVMEKGGVGFNNTSTTVKENKNTSKLDELLTKLCAELKIEGLTPEELKNSGILYRISGMNATEIANTSDSELQKIVDCLKAALKDSTVDGKVDIEKAGQLSNKYYVALCTGWNTIEQYKRNSKGEALSARMERFFGLDKKGIKFTELPQAKIEEYLQKYFNQFFVDKIKAAKTLKEKEEIYKKQLQDFGKLLNNTPDSEKAIFKQAISSLCASNRIKGLEAVLKSFDTPEARTDWANSWTVDEIEKVTTSKDVEGNTMKQEEAVACSVAITASSTGEVIDARHHEHHQKAREFFKENKDALAVIKEKEAKNEKLTPEEEALKIKRDNFIVGFKSGEIAGVAIHENLKQEVKAKLLALMNKDAYELPSYKEVMKQVDTYIQKHPEVLAATSKDEVNKLLDKATNGNYSKVSSGSNEPLTPPNTIPQENTSGENGLTGSTHYTAEEIQTKQENIAYIRQSISENSGDNNPIVFTVEKDDNTKLTTAETLSLKNKAYLNASGITDYLKQTGESKFDFAADVFKYFSQMGSTTQDWALNYFASESTTNQNLFLNKIKNSISGMVAAAKEVDLSNFNLYGISVTTQKKIDDIQEKRNLTPETT